MAKQVLPSLIGAVRLRDVTEGDLPIFFEQQRDPDANRMAAFSAREWAPFLAHWTKILADRTVPVVTIVVEGHVAGNIVSWERDGHRLVGYWLGRDYWGKGIATESLRKYLQVVRTRPLFAHTAKHNVASIRVLEKCGFTRCADAMEPPGRPSDGVETYAFRLCASERDESH